MSNTTKTIALARGKIQEILTQAVTDGVIGDWGEKWGLSPQTLQDDLQTYPYVILEPDFINTNLAEGFTKNTRIYSIPLAIVAKTEAVNPTEMSTLVESLVNIFDNKITLDGTAGYLTPATGQAMLVEGNTELVEAGIILNVHIPRDLNFIGQ